MIFSIKFSSLLCISTNIANQIVNARDSSLLTSVSSSFENSANVHSFSKFNFTSRSYEASQKANLVFVTLKKNSQSSSFETIRANSILDFIENSKFSLIAQALISNILNSAKLVSILQFVFHSKLTFSTQSAKITLNSKFIFSRQFSNKSITSKSNKQTVWTNVKYENSRNIFTVESTNIMSQEFINSQRRELMIMMQEFWIQRLTFSASSAASSTTQIFD